MNESELTNARIGQSYVCSKGQPMPQDPPDGTMWIHLNAKRLFYKADEDLHDNPNYECLYECPNCGIKF